MSKANITIELDKSVQNNQVFKKITSIDIHRFEIFKFAIFNDDPPDYISEVDVLEFLEGQIPKLEKYHEAYIGLDGKRILSFANEEKAIKISELIGAGVGLKYVTDLFGLNRNTIKKIKHDGINKRMDFSLNGDQIKLETKGTLYENNIKSFKNDIFSKKEQDNTNCLRIGTITIVRKKESSKPSKLIVCDDYTQPTENVLNIEHYLGYYLPILSLVLDNFNYNKLIKKLNHGDISRNMIYKNKIFGTYKHREITYLGNFFDRRLIFEIVRKFMKNSSSKSSLFAVLTRNEGVTKYFVGISEEIIDAINNLDVNLLRSFIGNCDIEEDLERILFLDIDGILIIKSSNFSDKRIEDVFPEMEVERRLRFEEDLYNKKPHACGASCRSKEKKGKSCEIKVYRGHCHFHR